MAEFLRVETDNHIATIILNNPPLNLVGPQLLEELAAEFHKVNSDEQVRVIILTGSGDRAFCAGGDRRIAASSTIENLENGVRLGRDAFNSIHESAVPVIGAINGPALGSGLAMAASCDILIASERAVFGLPEVNVGTWPMFKYLARLVPEMEMRRMVFTGQPLTAQEILRFGSVSCVVAHEKLMLTAIQLAREIAKKSRFFMQLYKEAFNRTEYLGIKESLPLEMGFIHRLLTSQDALLARKAFLGNKPSERGS